MKSFKDLNFLHFQLKWFILISILMRHTLIFKMYYFYGMKEHD